MALYLCSPEEALKESEEEIFSNDDDLSSSQEFLTPNEIPPLNIVILIVGSRGDVQPFVAFGKGLQEAGHRVRIATHINFKNFVEKEGIEFFPIGGDPEFLMKFMVEHPSMITLDVQEIKAKKKMMKEIYYSTWDACIGGGFTPDVIISNPPVHVHIHLAEKLQVPLHIMFTMPWSPTNDYMHPLVPFSIQQKISNRASYRIVDEMIWIGLGSVQNKFRKKILELPTITRGGNLVKKLRVPHIYCMSPHLAPKPQDWGSHIDVVGFWFLDKNTGYEPPQDLLDFLTAGPPPMYVGFGSIVVADPKKLSHDVIEAIKASGQRAVVSSGWAKLGVGMDLPDSIKLIGPCPHDWLFQRCSLVCHHGGAGTTAAGLRAGLPTVIVPFFGDQPFWGKCVARMGVGPEPIPIAELTKEKLTEAFKFCATEKVKQTAKELGKKLTTENGVTTAVNAFHKKLPFKDNFWVVQIYENQRYAPIAGWHAPVIGSDRAPFSDKTGTQTLHKENFVLPNGWEWVDDEWRVVVNDQTDPNGWKYATSFSETKNWKNERGTMDVVRTRKLERRRKYVGKEEQKETKEFCLYVDVIKAKGLAKKDIMGLSDPYIVMRVKNPKKANQQKKLTKVIDTNLNPEWNELFWFRVTEEDTLQLECWDKDQIKDDSLGNFEVKVKDVIPPNKESKNEKWFPLKGKNVSGEVLLAFHL